MAGITDTPLPFYSEPTEGEKLRAKGDRPLQSDTPQKPADFGLFDECERNQLDLVQWIREKEKR